MDYKISQQDIVKRLAQKHSMDIKDTEAFIDGMFDLIEEALIKDSIVKIKGLGTFKLVDVDNRESINVNTGERFQIKEHSKISFIPDSSLKEHINSPFAHFETVILNEGTRFDDMSPSSDNVLQTDGAADSDTNEENIDSKITENNPVSVEPTEENQDVIIEETIEPHNELFEDDAIDETSDLTVPSIVIDDEKTTASTQESFDTIPRKEKKRNKNLIMILSCVAVIFIAISAIAILLFRYDNSEIQKSQDALAVKVDKKSNVINDSQDTIPVLQEPNIVERGEETELINKEVGTVDNHKKDIINDGRENNVSDKIKNDIVKETTSKSSLGNSSVYNENLNYKIVALKRNHKVVAGETLRIISLKYYGTKKFWKYILEYNKSSIKDMNNLQLGCTLKIPELKVQK